MKARWIAPAYPAQVLAPVGVPLLCSRAMDKTQGWKTYGREDVMVVGCVVGAVGFGIAVVVTAVAVAEPVAVVGLVGAAVAAGAGLVRRTRGSICAFSSEWWAPSR